MNSHSCTVTILHNIILNHLLLILCNSAFHELFSSIYFSIIYIIFVDINPSRVHLTTSATSQLKVSQYSTVHYSTVQSSALQRMTVQYNTVECSVLQYSTVQYSAE